MEGVLCTACRITLGSQEECKLHYKSEFHTYNIKRKLVKLEPVSYELFVQKKQESENLMKASNFAAKCTCCGKTFNSQKAYEEHVSSKKKKPRSNQSEPEIHPLNSCLFCNLMSESLDENLKHMLVTHGFFIPDIDYLMDLEGLINYLQAKIRGGFICLYCKIEGRFAQAIQQHMIDKQHCFLNTVDDEEEFSPFYNWGDDATRDEIPAEITHTGELKLDSGKLIGHKDYFRFYKQNYRPRNTRHRELLAILSEEYKSLPVQTSWKTHPEVHRHTQARMLSQGLKNNSLQHHFRSQNTL